MFDDLFDDLLNDTPKNVNQAEKNWEDDDDSFDTGLIPSSGEVEPWTTGKKPDVWRT